MGWRLLACLAAVVAVVAVAVTRHGSPSAIAKAIDVTEASGTVEYSATTRFTGPAGTHDVVQRGAMDLSAPRGWRTMSSGSSRTDTIDNGATRYSRSVARGGPWLRFDFPKQGRSELVSILEPLRDVEDVRLVRTETIQGEPMRRYHGMAPAITKPGIARGPAPVDVWVDARGRLRRRLIVQSLESGVAVTDTLELTRFGVPVLTAPPAGEPVVSG